MVHSDSNLAAITATESMRSFYDDRPVLVVGADGFLGFHCVQALHTLGAKISIYSRRSQPRAAGMAHRVFKGDLIDRDVVQTAVRDQTIVFDFAGNTGATESNQHPLRNLEEECRPHLGLFESCAAATAKPLVVFCSSRLVYGKPRYLPVDETHPLAPESMYAIHKITLESYLRVFEQTCGLRWCVMRLSNPYGPHTFESTRSYGLINYFTRQAQQGQTIQVYGDGTQVRDYIHVDDAMVAFLSVAASPQCQGQTFNLGGPEGIRLRDAVEWITQTAGGTPWQSVPWPEADQTVETGDYVTDMSKLIQFIELPQQLLFVEGLNRTMNALGTSKASSALT